MGAEEEPEAKPKTSSDLQEQLVENLSDGWSVRVTGDGQLLLSPPAHYGDPDRAA